MLFTKSAVKAVADSKKYDIFCLPGGVIDEEERYHITETANETKSAIKAVAGSKKYDVSCLFGSVIDEEKRYHINETVNDRNELDVANAIVKLQKSTIEMKDDSSGSYIFLNMKQDIAASGIKCVNKAISAQSLLPCSDSNLEAIHLIEMTLKSKKSVSTYSKDVGLVMSMLKEASKNMETAATSHTSSFDKAVCRLKHVQEEDEYFMNNCDVS
eukprot:14402373-Ditylum_brightwellii.AAC.1